jgi:hypothetical protein
MKGPGLLSMLMFLTVAIFAYAEAAPRHGQRDSSRLFSRKVAKTTCPLGSHYSTFYNGCTHTWALTQASN